MLWITFLCWSKSICGCWCVVLSVFPCTLYLCHWYKGFYSKASMNKFQISSLPFSFVWIAHMIRAQFDSGVCIGVCACVSMCSIEFFVKMYIDNVDRIDCFCSKTLAVKLNNTKRHILRKYLHMQITQIQFIDFVVPFCLFHAKI